MLAVSAVDFTQRPRPAEGLTKLTGTCGPTGPSNANKFSVATEAAHPKRFACFGQAAHRLFAAQMVAKVGTTGKGTRPKTCPRDDSDLGLCAVCQKLSGIGQTVRHTSVIVKWNVYIGAGPKESFGAAVICAPRFQHAPV
jgi:hypothetical protein